MATILGESPSYKYNLIRGAQQDQQLRSQEKPFLNPGSGYNRDTFPTIFGADMDARTQYLMSEAGQQDLLNKNKPNQRNQGGAGATNGATIGSAVNRGTAAQEPPKPSLGEVPSVDEITNTARGNTTYTPKFGQPVDQLNDTVTTLSGDKLPLGVVNENRDMNSRSGSTVVGEGDNTSLGNNFNESNTNPRPSGSGAFSTYTTPNYEASIAALKDLREAKIKAAGGRGNRGTGPSIEELQNPGYSADLASYNSGDVGSEGYNRIRNERMNLESMIEDQQHELQRTAQRSGRRGMKGLAEAKAGVAENILNQYGESQRARLGLEGKQVENKTELAKAGMANLSEQEKLRLAQNKQLMDQFNADRQFGLDSNRFGLDTEKAAVDRDYKYGQLETDRAKLGQLQADFGLKVADTESQIGKRNWEIAQGQTEGLRKAYETGQEPIKNAANIMKQEGGLASLPAAARVQLLRSLGLDPELIDPEGYAAVQQQTGK